MNRFDFLATLAMTAAASSPAQAWNPTTMCPNGSCDLAVRVAVWHLSDKYNGTNNFYGSLSDAAVEAVAAVGTSG